MSQIVHIVQNALPFKDLPKLPDGLFGFACPQVGEMVGCKIIRPAARFQPNKRIFESTELTK